MEGSSRGWFKDGDRQLPDASVAVNWVPRSALPFRATGNLKHHRHLKGFSMGESLSRHLSVQVVSRMIGVKVRTLNRWRQKGRGPSGWLRLSKTHGVYEAEAVLRWLDEKKKASS